MRDLVGDLLDARKYEDVVICLEQAILHGQAQPWMYQVLAVAMEAAGRPKSQIERVMMSSQDMVANDLESMMQLAAYLARFKSYDRAIELYRQAAAIEPSRPEPYVMALEIAILSKNYQAVAWSAPEVLSYSWSKGRERLNKTAEQAAAEASRELIKAGNYPLALELQAAMRKARQLDLVVRLEWSGKGDLDIQVVEPGGAECSVINPMTVSGGIFVHDGFGPNQAKCYEEYLCPQGLRGEYKVIIRHNSGDIVGKRARLTIIRDRGTNLEEAITETIFLSSRDQSVRFFLNHGRRKNADAAVNDSKRDSKPVPPGSVYAQLGGAGGIGAIGFRGTAVGYTTVVTEIPEGIRMSAMATVSGDRRYVRITAQPIFSSITDVFTFGYVK